MADKTPQMGPGDLPAGFSSTGGDVTMPGQLPPAASINTEFSASALTIMAGASDAAPALPLTAVTAIGASTWQNNKKINALWSINQNRNSWVGVEGIGWKKLVNNSDSAIVALTMLASHARQKGSVVNYREESDGMIYEMYVW
jgi:hypothetical protein